MRLCKFAFTALLLLLLCFSVSVAGGLFRGGFFRGRCHCVGRQAQMAACKSVAMPECNYATPEACTQCPGGICNPQGKDACNCSAGCCCDAGSCPCKIGKEPCSPGCRCQLEAKSCQAKPAVDPVQFPGIPAEHFAKIGKEERYEVNGKRVSKQQVIQALTTVPDDRKELSLSFMGGTELGRQQAVALAKELNLDAKTLIQCYDANNPIVKSRGFVTPSVYLQAPDGKVLLRSNTMDKATLLAVADKAASYDPSKDATPNTFSLDAVEKQLASIPAWVWFAVAIGILLLYQKAENKKQ